MTEIEIKNAISQIETAIRREQDLAILERDQPGKFVQHAINVIAISGILDYFRALDQKGVKLLVPENALKEIGIGNVDS